MTTKEAVVNEMFNDNLDNINMSCYKDTDELLTVIDNEFYEMAQDNGLLNQDESEKTDSKDKVDYMSDYSNDISGRKKLSQEEIEQCVDTMHDENASSDKKKEAKDKLVVSVLNLVVKTVIGTLKKKYEITSELEMELVLTANERLLKIVDNYDYTKGKLSTYVVNWLRYDLQNEYFDKKIFNTVKVPRAVKVELSRLKNEQKKFKIKHEYNPSQQDLAAVLFHRWLSGQKQVPTDEQIEKRLNLIRKTIEYDKHNGISFSINDTITNDEDEKTEFGDFLEDNTQAPDKIQEKLYFEEFIDYLQKNGITPFESAITMAYIELKAPTYQKVRNEIKDKKDAFIRKGLVTENQMAELNNLVTEQTLAELVSRIKPLYFKFIK